MSASTCAHYSVLIDPSTAQAAYRHVTPRLLDIPQDRIMPLRGDMQRAAAFALDVARFINAPAVRARFARLAGTDEYDDTCTNDLGHVALAAWYTRHRFLTANMLRLDVTLPVALLDEAILLRGRLAGLVERRLSRLPAVDEEMAALRTSSGCQDFAGDLLALAQICERHHTALVEDRWHYRPDDVARAREISGELAERLGEVTMHHLKSWSSMQPRAWTLLSHTYGQVRRAGRFLFPGEDGEARFPPLVSVARAAA